MRLTFTTPNHTLPLFVDSIGYQWPQPAVTRPAGYPYYHWLQSELGQGVVTLPERTLTLAPGQGLLIASHLPHAYQPLGPHWQTSYLTFGGTLVHELATALNLGSVVVVTNAAPALSGFIQAHYQALATSETPKNLMASQLVYAFLLRVHAALTPPLSDPTMTAVAKQVQQLIVTDYARPLQNADYIQLTHYTMPYILRAFRATYGVTPKQFLTTLRLRKVKELLIKKPGLSLAAISMTVGFQSESQLINTFKRQEHVTPGTFRRWFHQSPHAQ